MNAGHISPRGLIDLSRIDELTGVSKGPRGIELGSMTCWHDLDRAWHLNGGCEAVVEVCAALADRQIRQAATIGGSLCWNAPASSLPAVALCLGAEVELWASPQEKRRLSMPEFMTGSYQTARAPGELLVALHLPPQNLKTASAFRKVGVTTGGAPIVAVAAFLELDQENTCIGARIGIGGITPVARLVEGAEERFAGWRGEAEHARAAAAELAQAVPTQSDHLASAEYRTEVIAALSAEALLAAYRRALRE